MRIWVPSGRPPVFVSNPGIMLSTRCFIKMALLKSMFHKNGTFKIDDDLCLRARRRLLNYRRRGYCKKWVDKMVVLSNKPCGITLCDIIQHSFTRIIYYHEDNILSRG